MFAHAYHFRRFWQFLLCVHRRSYEVCVCLARLMARFEGLIKIYPAALVLVGASYLPSDGAALTPVVCTLRALSEC